MSSPFSCCEGQLLADLHPRFTDPTFDPVAKSKEDRKARKDKNESQRFKNLQRAAANAASQQKTSASALSEREQRKKMIERELKVTKTSTASLGKFDPKLNGESKEKNVKRRVSRFRKLDRWRINGRQQWPSGFRCQSVTCMLCLCRCRWN